MHRLLERQIRRHFGKDFQPDENLSAFLAIIDSAYHDADKEQLLLQNALTVNAAELSEANERIRRQAATELDFQKYALDQHAIVSISDSAGKIIYANQKFIDISQYSESELLGMDHRIVNSGYHPSSYFQEMWRTIASGKIWHGEVRNRSKDGTFYWVDSTIVPFMDEHGKPLRYVSIRTNITARKQAEEIAMAAKIAAEEASRAKSEFLANMSHEIRTPMNGIIGMTELALDTELKAEQKEYLGLVKVSADALLSIVNDILDFSKIEAGRMDLESIEFNLIDMLSQTCRAIALRAHQKGLELLLDIGPDIPEVLIGDPGRIRQIIINLIGNAIKFTEHGEIVVRVALSDLSSSTDEVRLNISVQDTGIGIPKEKFQTIFESFSQVDSATTRKYGGTGLGLTISTRLVELMRGRISVESELGKGSTFTLEIGLGYAKDRAQPHFETRRLNDLRALVVDDNATNRRLAFELLRRWGMKPYAVEDGQQAIAELARARSANEGYQLILLDVRMPGMNGFEVVEYLRTHPEYVVAPIMMLTSEGQRGDAARCRELNISAYLLKPYSQSDLFDAIMNTLGRDAIESKPLVTRHNLQKNTQKLNILLAEDNSVNQLLATRLLKKFGHELVVAENGAIAVEKWQTGQYDLILMDVDMPVMNGHDATRRIRMLEQTQGKHIPIIGLTAHVMQGSREECLAVGMDGYLSKPINTDALWAELEAIRADSAPVKEVVSERTETSGAIDYVFELPKALFLMDNDMELFSEMVRIFLEDYPDKLQKLEQAIALSDAKEIRHLSHTIKGMLSVFAVATLADVAERIEKQVGVDHTANCAELKRGLMWLAQELQSALGK